jgi:hypothetical protein
MLEATKRLVCSEGRYATTCMTCTNLAQHEVSSHTWRGVSAQM